jgi:hypothetical protein
MGVVEYSSGEKRNIKFLFLFLFFFIFLFFWKRENFVVV